MNIHRNILDDYEQLQEIIRTAILHSEGKLNKEIAEELGSTNVNIARNLRKAREMGISWVGVYPRPLQEFGKKLLRKYPLREAYVYPIGVPTEITSMLSRLAAIYLDGLLDNGIPLFSIKSSHKNDLDKKIISEDLKTKFTDKGIPLSDNASVRIQERSTRWLLTDAEEVYIVKKRKNNLGICKKAARVAIGPGSTMLGLARSLSETRRPEIRVGSTVFVSMLEIPIASNIIGGIAAGRWECEFRRFDSNMPVDEQKDYADILIFGIAKMMDRGSSVVLSLESGAYIDDKRSQETLHGLAAGGGVGIINYQPIDRQGNPLSWDIVDFDHILETSTLKLETIREMAKDRKKRVICVAGGEDKVDGIKAGLESGYFNVLITNYSTAEAILK